MRASRAQADKRLYRRSHEDACRAAPKALTVYQASVVALGGRGRRASPVSRREIGRGRSLPQRVILTTGTFLNGLMHVGLRNFSGGAPAIRGGGRL